MKDPQVVFGGGWKILSSEVEQRTVTRWRTLESMPLLPCQFFSGSSGYWVVERDL